MTFLPRLIVVTLRFLLSRCASCRIHSSCKCEHSKWKVCIRQTVGLTVGCAVFARPNLKIWYLVLLFFSSSILPSLVSSAEACQDACRRYASSSFMLSSVHSPSTPDCPGINTPGWKIRTYIKAAFSVQLVWPATGCEVAGPFWYKKAFRGRDGVDGLDNETWGVK